MSKSHPITTMNTRLGFILLFVLLLTTKAVAQPPGLEGLGGGIPDATKAFTWSAKFEPETAGPGDAVKLIVTAKISQGWHTYPTMKQEYTRETALTLLHQKAAPAFLTAKGEWIDPKGKKSGDEIHVYPDKNGEAVYTRWYVVNANPPIGKQELTVHANWQPCTEDSCADPLDAEMAVALTLKAEAVGSKLPAEIGVGTTPPSTSNQVGASSAPSASVRVPNSDATTVGKGDFDMLAFMIQCVVLALVSIFTPCVFPMIPITLSYFLSQAEEGAKKYGAAAVKMRQLYLALIYAAGIIFTFSVVGFILAAVVGLSVGEQLASSWPFNLAIGVIFILLTLSFFGLFELTIPSEVVSFLQRLGGEKAGATISTFMMGVIFSMTSFACTGPIAIFPLLSSLGRGADWTIAGLGMVVFGVAFAVPFLFLALFPLSLPASGPWMVRVKVVMGFVLLFCAVPFLAKADSAAMAGLMPRELVLCLWAATLATLGWYLFGQLSFKLESKPEKNGPWATFIGILCFGAALHLLGVAYTGYPSLGQLEPLLPPNHRSQPTINGGTSGYPIVPAAPNVPRAKHDGGWFNDVDEALAEAKKSSANPLVFVDFSGNVCPVCKANRENVFTKPVAHEAFKPFVLAHVYVDTGAFSNDPVSAAKHDALRATLNGKGVKPYYAVIDPITGKALGTTFGSQTPDSIAQFLKDCAAKR